MSFPMSVTEQIEVIRTTTGYTIAVGTKVIVTADFDSHHSKRWTVISRSDPRYIAKFPESAHIIDRYVPFVNEDGYIDGIVPLMFTVEAPIESSKPDELDKSGFGYNVAIKDINAQGVLKTFMMELHLLTCEYDMDHTIFGDKITELMDSFYNDMNK